MRSQIELNRASQRSQSRPSQKGHAMIELAMSATVMTMFLAGTFQFGYTFYVYNQLVTAIGNGSRAKLAVNLVLGLNRVALAEGLAFGERLGLDAAAFLDVLKGSAAYSQVMDTKGRKMVTRDFTSEGKVTQHLKDVHLILEQAGARGQELPLATVNAALLEACVARGEADLDNSIVIEEIRRRRTGAKP